MVVPVPPLLLEAVAGPHALRVELPATTVHVLGRGAGATLLLDDPTALVSRRHAQVQHEGNEWRITDLGSKHGTRLNGVPIAPNQPLPIRTGDLMTIGPWTLMLGAPDGADGSTVPGASGLGTLTGIASRRRLTEDDRAVGSRGVRALRAGDATLAADRLGLLLQVAEGIHRAEDLTKLAEAVLSTVAAGTRFGNVALLRPMAADGSVEIVALRTDEGTSQQRFRFSRSILLQASTGVVTVRTGADSSIQEGQSIAELDITEALCVPFVVDGVVLALLYMDNRHGRRMTRGGSDDREFAVAVGRIAGLAMRNLLQRDMEARLASVNGELAAAAQMQQMIMPAGRGELIGLQWSGRYRPGRVVSGDFFDLVPLPDGRLAIALGDVSGKGVGAAVLAVLAQGFIRGTLLSGAPLDGAMRQLQSFVWEKAEAERFVTLWLGAIDPRTGRLAYVDAGHGHAHLLVRGGAPMVLAEGGGPPLGAVDNAQYQLIERSMPQEALLLLVSDGLVEQQAPGGESAERVGTERLLASIPPDVAPHDAVEIAFQMVDAWACTNQLADDATVLAVRRL